MACSLDHDASGKYDFTAHAGSDTTVKVTANGSARFVTARFNNTVLNVQNGDTIHFTIAAGINILKLVVAVADPNDMVRIIEDCGGGTQVLDQFKNDPSDPVTGYSIIGF
ncbi:MAG: hypothetical protein LAO78_23415 [Acidobacteriia bacterium]|nr:hypothetical protein [Terriglobia bacterium]